jgi:hypothetical protein
MLAGPVCTFETPIKIGDNSAGALDGAAQQKLSHGNARREAAAKRLRQPAKFLFA